MPFTRCSRIESATLNAWDGRMKSLTKHQKIVLIVAWLGWVFDVMEASLFALTKQPMLTQMLGEKGFEETGTQWGGYIHTAMLLGWSIGGLIFGIVADRWGRSKTLLLTVFLYCLFTGLTSLCQTPQQVWGARFLTGLGIGGEWAAGVALIAETMPNDFRARAAAFLQTAAAFGSITGVFINIAIGGLDWRLVYLAGIAPALLCFVARYKLEPDKPIIQDEPDEKAELKSFTNPVLAKRLLIAVVIGVAGITGGGLLPFWLPDYLKEIVPKESLAYYKNIGMIILHLGTLAGVLVFPPLTEKYGRRPMFAFFGVMSGLMLILTTTFAKTLTMVYIFAPLTSFFALGLTAGFGLYFPELFPRSVRATGSGIAYNTGRVLSAPLPIWIGQNVKAIGFSKTFAMLSCVYLLMLVALYFAPETKGQPLED
jgi:MFS family permease